MKLKHTLIVLDIEATGTWVDRDRVIEVGMVKCFVDGRQETYVKRVNPGMLIPASVTRLTGISNDDVKDAPSFKEIAREVIDFIGDSDLGGFNAERFDLPILEREFNAAGLSFDWRDRNIFDAQKVYHVNEKRDLTAAYQFYCGKKLVSAHSALADTVATLEILDAQVKKYGKESEDIECLEQFDYGFPEEYFDKERKFRWWNGELYPTFGKYSRKYSVKKIAQIDRSFLEWILTRDFSVEVKGMIEGVLGGRMPIYPGGR